MQVSSEKSPSGSPQYKIEKCEIRPELLDMSFRPDNIPSELKQEVNFISKFQTLTFLSFNWPNKAISGAQIASREVRQRLSLPSHYFRVG